MQKIKQNKTIMIYLHGIKWFLTYLVCFGSLSNLRTLQKSALSTSAGGEQWQEKPLCLGSTGTCGSMLMGHILGFGEDEIGEWG